MKTVGIGFYWNDLKVGDKFRTLNRTITEPDIVNFIGVTGMVETLFTDLSFQEHGGVMRGRVAPAAWRRIRICAACCWRSLRRKACASSPRRSACAPTTAR